jgi:hypothetical protein
VSSFRQIELFCQSDKQECNPVIATCLSDAAFKAVEKVVKVSICAVNSYRKPTIEKNN